MASIIDREEAEYIEGLTSEQARAKVNEGTDRWGSEYNTRNSAESVYDISIPFFGTYTVPVWAGSEADAIRTAERFVDRELKYATDQLDVCCGEVTEFVREA